MLHFLFYSRFFMWNSGPSVVCGSGQYFDGSSCVVSPAGIIFDFVSSPTNNFFFLTSGTFVKNVAVAVPYKCPHNSPSTAGSTSCTCGPGYFLSTTMSLAQTTIATCVLCRSGMYSNSFGATACTLVPAGMCGRCIVLNFYCLRECLCVWQCVFE